MLEAMSYTLLPQLKFYRFCASFIWFNDLCKQTKTLFILKSLILIKFCRDVSKNCHSNRLLQQQLQQQSLAMAKKSKF